MPAQPEWTLIENVPKDQVADVIQGNEGDYRDFVDMWPTKYRHTSGSYSELRDGYDILFRRMPQKTVDEVMQEAAGHECHWKTRYNLLQAENRDVVEISNTALMRLRLAKDALIATGYFKPEEVGDDIAPRITELHSHFARHMSADDEPTIEINVNSLVAKAARRIADLIEGNM